jgi:cysteinyl-tRNA synthetase
MGTLTLLKFYSPFSSTLFSHSARAVFPCAAVFRKKKLHSFRAVSSSSQPLAAEKNCNDGENFRSKSSSPEIWLHNTMSKKKELFKPKVESKVGMYVCGVTAYDLSHIGHARVYVNFDLLYRFISSLNEKKCFFFLSFWFLVLISFHYVCSV